MGRRAVFRFQTEGVAVNKAGKLPKPQTCCGCGACGDACPVSAIAFRPDGEGFLHPEIDAAKCIGCGRCVAVCPVAGDGSPRVPLSVWAAKAKDDSIRLESSSGGLFSLLAGNVLQNGGVVYGAAYDPRTGTVRHVRVADMSELQPIRGSKYVQSDATGAYAMARKDIAQGRSVLFSGTPCQIAAVKRFIGTAGGVPDLLLVEVVCMGASSPLAFAEYLRSNFRGQGALPDAVSFRDKTRGWKRYSMSFASDGARKSAGTLRENPYLRGMSARLFMRRCCAGCRFRQLKSGADITLGDYWNVRRKFPEMDDDKGISLVLANTEKGRAAVAAVLPSCDCAESDWADATAVNPALVRSVRFPSRRNRFFDKVGREDFCQLVSGLCRPPLWKRICRAAKKPLRGVLLSRSSGK